jgi:Ca2+-binding EF-hand superfamily protein
MKTLPPAAFALLAGLSTFALVAQQPAPAEERPERPQRREVGPGGPGGPGGRVVQFQRANPLMQALDTDKNGELSAAEIAAAPAALKTLDQNGDGKLSGDEVRPPQPEGQRSGPRANDNTEAVTRLMANDKNGDGKLSVDEMPERMKRIVARADVDKDGFATKEEIAQALNEPGGNRGPGGPEGDRPQRQERRPEAQPK